MRCNAAACRALWPSGRLKPAAERRSARERLSARSDARRGGWFVILPFFAEIQGGRGVNLWHYPNWFSPFSATVLATKLSHAPTPRPSEQWLSLRCLNGDASKTRKNGEKMGEIWSKRCEGVGITWRVFRQRLVDVRLERRPAPVELAQLAEGHPHRLPSARLLRRSQRLVQLALREPREDLGLPCVPNARS